MLISNEYKEENKRLHEMPEYGVSSKKWAVEIAELAIAYDAEYILDYGCGKGLVKQILGDRVMEYDPAIEGKDATPEPQDLCVCTDVLEHIEPDLLDSVLADLRRVTKKVGFYTIESRPAQKFLSDGRNAHLIQEPYIWWLNKLVGAGFNIRVFQNLNGKFKVIVE